MWKSGIRQSLPVSRYTLQNCRMHPVLSTVFASGGCKVRQHLVTGDVVCSRHNTDASKEALIEDVSFIAAVVHGWDCRSQMLTVLLTQYWCSIDTSLSVIIDEITTYYGRDLSFLFYQFQSLDNLWMAESGGAHESTKNRYIAVSLYVLSERTVRTRKRERK